MPLPLVVGAGISVATKVLPSLGIGGKTPEQGIQDRLGTFSTWTNEHLYRAMRLGGEDREAALRVLQSRGMPSDPPQTIIDWWNAGSKGTAPDGSGQLFAAQALTPAISAGPMLGPPAPQSNNNTIYFVFAIVALILLTNRGRR